MDETQPHTTMMTQDGLNELADEVAKLNGLERRLAGQLVALCADTPEHDADGLVCITKDGTEYKLKWPAPEEE